MPTPYSLALHRGVALRTLAAAVTVAIAGGSNYAFSAYAPQLALKLSINSRDTNIIALSGHAGIFLMGPIWGRIIDSRGPTELYPVSFVCLLVGYSGIRLIFDNGSNNDYRWLLVCSFLTGAGSSAAMLAAINVTAKTFPDRIRTTTTGLVLAGFGLSAFILAASARAVFGIVPAAETSRFLLYLSLSTSLPMLFVGYFFVRVPWVIAMESNESTSVESSGVDDSVSIDSRTSLLASFHNNLGVQRAVEEGRKDVHGAALFPSLDFWHLFIMFALLTGTSSMYFNNVGSISRALSGADATYNASEDDQSKQVSILSIMNCIGRFSIGLIADAMKTHAHIPRSSCLILVSTLYLISQLTIMHISSVDNLWKASVLLGIAHGTAWGLFPTLAMEWLGIPHLSETWGYIGFATVAGGAVFSLFFGRNFDRHMRDGSEGLELYIASIYLTIG